MRPALKSGLLPVWRDRETLQIGIDPRRAVALSPMGQAALLVGLLDGSRSRDQVIAAAAGQGIGERTAERILTLLAAAGVLDDFPAGTLREVPPRKRAGLAAELATTSLANGDGDGGARSLARRRGTHVRVDGDRRVALAIARVLAAAGIGQVTGPPALATAGPDSRPGTAAAIPQHAGLPAHRRAAAQPHVDLAARRRPADAPRLLPGPDSQPQAEKASRSRRDRGPTQPPDLLVLVGYQRPELIYQLIRQRIPHLAASASEAIGIVGPFVVPGRTACLRCLDHFRADHDPSWPLILAQLARRRPEPAACDAALAAAVAAQAACQVLAAIDRTPAASAAVNGTLELVLPSWQWRRRSWPRHPACLCGGPARLSA